MDADHKILLTSYTLLMVYILPKKPFNALNLRCMYWIEDSVRANQKLHLHKIASTKVGVKE